MLKILLTSEWLVKTGGTGTFVYTIAGELKNKGHDVYLFANEWGELADKICRDLGVKRFIRQKYDLILANHNTTVEKVHKYGLTIQTCHGIFPKLEQPSKYADGHIAISQEVQIHLLKRGYPSIIIHNPIDCNRFKPTIPLKDKNPKVLSLCHTQQAHQRIKKIAEELNYSFEYLDKRENWIWDVEDKINSADIVVGLGRSAYEALACGRPVIIYDERHYYGPAGDGYFKDVFFHSIQNNCSGRALDIKFTDSALKKEFLKYNPSDSSIARDYALKYFNVKDAIDAYLNFKLIIEEKQDYHKITNKLKRFIYKKTEPLRQFIPSNLRKFGKEILLTESNRNQY